MGLRCRTLDRVQHPGLKFLVGVGEEGGALGPGQACAEVLLWRSTKLLASRLPPLEVQVCSILAF